MPALKSRLVVSGALSVSDQIVDEERTKLGHWLSHCLLFLSVLFHSVTAFKLLKLLAGL